METNEKIIKVLVDFDTERSYEDRIDEVKDFQRNLVFWLHNSTETERTGWQITNAFGILLRFEQLLTDLNRIIEQDEKI